MKQPKQKNLFRNSIIGIVLISVFSNFIGEKIITPFAIFIYTKTSNVLSLFFETYNNAIYRNISGGFNDENSFFLLFLVPYFGFIFLFYLAHVKNVFKQGATTARAKSDFECVYKEDDDDIDDANFDIKKFALLALKAIALLAFQILLVAFLYGQFSFIQRTKTSTLNNIEIVSPYIEDIEYKQLKSDFHSMESKQDYDSLIEKLTVISSEYNIRLKE